ncbi:hypothetical protein, variant [Puccinia triticina 1-1 BBBD Race 1]|uniref:Stc1 domain-containing protein n=2 Tax=Puccinia triticina TaxID=208348 RepID=A0A180GEF6_PUCT1|nr:uncharacterized protein PtA15_12A175 [Puccinia triticina]OAV91069.1 hypothetical protein PTTG_28085 [Puccinia triticina 1-1 BBBD Race 1]OAV91070.1 hypothetical protein, variant [Puccinia triticina 1-1 BBBD Race 1]WAQ90189.1 hypothetical protein PtA15_12A175 [Puccinia triticina]WAR61480.1 hypothetical protein PtB15_12B165 [Puccinia triticina]
MKLATLPQGIFLAVLLLSSTVWAKYTCAHCGKGDADIKVTGHQLEEMDTCGFDLGAQGSCARQCRKQILWCKACHKWTGRNVPGDATLTACGHHQHYYQVDPITGVRAPPLIPYKEPGAPPPIRSKRPRGRPPGSGSARRKKGPTNAEDASTSAADDSTSNAPRVYYNWL